jgi:hypothetical protein
VFLLPNTRQLITKWRIFFFHIIFLFWENLFQKRSSSKEKIHFKRRHSIQMNWKVHYCDFNINEYSSRLFLFSKKASCLQFAIILFLNFFFYLSFSFFNPFFTVDLCYQFFDNKFFSFWWIGKNEEYYVIEGSDLYQVSSSLDRAADFVRTAFTERVSTTFSHFSIKYSQILRIENI